MANLVENAEWVDGIYQLETLDPVEGGPNGIDNLQAKQLGNRTLFLKALIESAQNALSGHEAAADPHPQYLTTAEGNSIIATAVAELVGQSPVTLNTLNELASALGNDPNFATSMATALGNKQPLDQTLTALAALATAANKLIYATGPDAFALTDLTEFSRLVLSCSDAASLQSLISAVPAVPAGTVGSFAMSSAPVGWLKANGAAISRTSYAGLFSVIGTTFGAGNGSTTFNIPDLRGEFIRGLDDGRGIDSGRTLGSFQESTLFRDWVGDMGQLHHRNDDGHVNQPDAQQYTADTDNFTTQDYFRIRPRNIAFLTCIKY